MRAVRRAVRFKDQAGVIVRSQRAIDGRSTAGFACVCVCVLCVCVYMGVCMTTGPGRTTIATSRVVFVRVHAMAAPLGLSNQFALQMRHTHTAHTEQRRWKSEVCCVRAADVGNDRVNFRRIGRRWRSFVDY